MKNIKLSFVLMMGVLSITMLNSCSSSRSFEGYYPENRITGKGPGYNNIEQPTTKVETTTDEVVVVEETTTAPTTEVTATEEVAATPTAPKVDMTQLTPREQKWVNKLGITQVVDPTAQPKKMNFMERAMMKMFSKMAQRQAQKHFDGAGIQAMDIADIFAIVSISAGGLAWFTYYGVFLFGIAAIVFGVLALRRGTSRRGMAIAGICLGAIALFFWIALFGFVIGVGWF